MNGKPRSASARTAVLDAAARLFDERGYAAVSIADLTAASGVSNGSIYHHFGAKDGVLAELMIDALGGFQDELLAILAEHPSRPDDAVRAAVEFHLHWFERHRRSARLIIAYRDTVAEGSAGRERLHALNRNFLHRLDQWLRDHTEAGRIPEQADLELLHAICFAPAYEVGQLWLAGRIAKQPSAFAEALAEAACAGLWSLGRRKENSR